MNIKFIVIYILSITLLNSCKKESPIEPESYGNLCIEFTHTINQQNIFFDSLLYTNQAGNRYLISELQYFISNITLINSKDNKLTTLTSDVNTHYIDTDIPSTLKWDISEKIIYSNYDSIQFTFGLDPNTNKSYLFKNPPESSMFWPEILGGGYHYLKFNGKYLKNDSLTPFNIHLGKGQIYANNEIKIENMIQTIDLNFNIRLSLKKFVFLAHNNNKITINMEVNNWFDGQFNYDLNKQGTSTMQNYIAMATLCENGKKVFTIK